LSDILKRVFYIGCVKATSSSFHAARTNCSVIYFRF